MAEQSSVTFVPKHSSLSFDSKTVEDYVLSETLGQGSCAIVKLGTHRVTGERVAVKIIKPSTMQKQKEVLREVEALRILSHPNIIQLHKVIRENGFVCIILEFGKGGELFNYILNNGRLTEVHARKLFRQMLSGIQYCHANLVIHRDLKPENIMLDANGDAKISDFGLSNFLKPNSLFGTFCGSPIYTPPEIVLHRKYNGALSDVWSLGVILFVMVTGGMPWRLENNKVQNLESLLAAHFKLPDSLGLSESLKDLIRSMLVAEANQRASIEDLVSHPWICEGYEGKPLNIHLPRQQLVPLADINHDLLKQLSLLAMDVPKACVAIQSDPHSPALTAYRALLQKHSKVQQVMSDMFLGDVPQAPSSPSRVRARSDPAADRLKMEKTRLEKVKQESEAANVDSKEKDRIREKIKKWRALHKNSLNELSNNDAIVNQASTVVYVENTSSSSNDKSKVEKLKSFLSYFRKQLPGSNNINNNSSNNNSPSKQLSNNTIKVTTATKDHLPLKQYSSPVVTRRSAV